MFIEDRRKREPLLTGYTETHHIRPKCMGGTDVSENLIRLTAEDHYFAHLLLAKAHGGKNWSALHAMATLVKKDSHRKSLRMRIKFGHVRRALAAHYRKLLGGPDGKIADKRKFKLRSFDGLEICGNRFELSAETGISRARISSVLLGLKLSAGKWFDPRHNPEGVTRSARISQRVRKSNVISLYHHDGRVWAGTQWQFRREFGAQLTFQHPTGCVQGWYRTPEQAATHGILTAKKAAIASLARGDISGQRNPNADSKRYDFVVLATGERLTATKTEIRERFGIKSPQMCSLFNGRQRQTGGIALASQEEGNPRRAEYPVVRDLHKNSRRSVRRAATEDGALHERRFQGDFR